MKVEVKITSKQKSDVVLAGSYPYKNKERIWYDRILTDEFDLTPKKDEKRPPSNDLFFTRTKDSHVLTYEVDKDGKPLTPEDKAIMKVIDFFLKNHPLCTVNGVDHPNTASPLFDITDKATEVATRLTKWDRRRRIANFLAESDLQTTRDIMYFYGHSPKGRSHGDICLLLADYDTGLLFNADSSGNDSSVDFMKTFIKNANPDAQLVIHARKAIEFGLIQPRTINGNTGYYHLGVFCGNEALEIVDYFKRNERIYKEHILRKIAESDHFADEVRMSEVEKASIKDEATLGAIELDKFRDQVQELANTLADAGVSHGYSRKDKKISKMGYDKLKVVYDELVDIQKELKPAEANEPAT